MTPGAASLLLFAPSAARAATLDVCDTCPYTTIADAVSAATDGDRILIAPDTYTEDVSITKSLTLVGAGSGRTVLVNAANADPAITVSGACEVEISGLTLDDLSSDDLGMVISGAVVSLTDIEVVNHMYDGGTAGSALVIESGSSVRISDSAFQDNWAQWSGAAILAWGSTLEIRDTKFTFNSSHEWAGTLEVADSDLTIRGCTFADNIAERSIAGALLLWSGTADIRDTTFERHYCNSSFGGGAIYLDAGASMTLDTVTMTENESSSSSGGAVYMKEGRLTVNSSTFVSNDAAGTWAARGGAIFVMDGSIDITASDFRGNTAGEYGGAIAIEAGDLRISRSRFTGNSNDAVWASVDSTNVTNSLFCANTGFPLDGGGEWTISNNVFAENSLGIFGSATVGHFANNTFLGNGFAASVYDDLTWINNIAASTTTYSALSGRSIPAPVIQYGNWYLNAAGDLGADLAALTLDETNITSDPLIADWSADGDCTNDDFTLAAGSPAIDAGDPSYTDPDGTRSDIGAYGGPGAEYDGDGDGFISALDCDDADADAFPGATEACEDVDRDCDGTLGTADADGDGWMQCDDCDDADASVHPGASEPCNGADDDCDGAADEDGATWGTTWYADADEDGYGNAGVTVVDCDAPSGHAHMAHDCDDADPETHPGASEVWYDGIDQGCDGGDDFDRDGDGWASDDFGGEDCDDRDPDERPGAEEPCDGVDNDCDGALDEDGATFGTSWYQDADGDGHGDASSSVTECGAPPGYVSTSDDCDDSDPATFPGAPEEPGDGVDQDCDGADAPPTDDTDTVDTSDTDDTNSSARGGCGCAAPSTSGARSGFGFVWALLSAGGCFARSRRSGGHGCSRC